MEKTIKIKQHNRHLVGLRILANISALLYILVFIHLLDIVNWFSKEIISGLFMAIVIVNVFINFLALVYLKPINISEFTDEKKE